MNAPRTALAGSVVALTLALGGCSGTPLSTFAPPPAGGAAEPADSRGAPAAAPAAPAPPNKDVPELAPSEANRQVARTAQLAVKVGDPAQAAAGVRSAVTGLGGLVTAERIVTEQRDGYYLRPSTMTVAVPSGRLDEALDALAKVGTLTDRTVNAVDVTAQVVDTEARIKTLRESIARIQALMEKTGSVAEIAQVESELTSRQAQLESLLGQQKALSERVAMATVTVTLTPEVSVATPNPLLQGLQDGWSALLISLRALITFVGGVIPFAVVAALIALPIRAWLRRRRGRGGVSTRASSLGATQPTEKGDAPGATQPAEKRDAPGATQPAEKRGATQPTEKRDAPGAAQPAEKSATQPTEKRDAPAAGGAREASAEPEKG